MVTTNQANSGDAFTSLIESAVEAAVRKALDVQDATNRRLLSVEKTAEYLSLSEREVYNMIANRVFPAVKHGRRTLVDVQDLNLWIDANKRGMVPS